MWGIQLDVAVAAADGHREQHKGKLLRVQDFIDGQIGGIDAVGLMNQFGVVPIQPIPIGFIDDAGGRGGLPDQAIQPG